MLLNRITFAVAIAAMALMTTTATAQRGGGGGPGGMMGNSSLGLINDKNVIAELELTSDQIESLKELQDDMRDVFRESFSGMRERFREEGVDREELMSEIREKIKTEMKGVEGELSEILLPFQSERLEQLSMQMRAGRSGTTGLLSSPEVKEKLGITDEQIEEMKAKTEEVREELNVKMKELREEARQDILSVLTSDQQAQIKEMMGESFEFEQRRGGGDRGGRGGDRGGRGGEETEEIVADAVDRVAIVNVPMLIRIHRNSRVERESGDLIHLSRLGASPGLVDFRKYETGTIG